MRRESDRLAQTRLRSGELRRGRPTPVKYACLLEFIERRCKVDLHSEGIQRGMHRRTQTGILGYSKQVVDGFKDLRR